MGRPNECCNVPENMETKQEREDLKIDTCKVCGSRHFELTAEIDFYGLIGAKVGG